MRKSKWGNIKSPNEPVCDVACRVIAQRLELVGYYLPLAADHYQEEIEYVHQLRVASRRAVAALQIFSSLLPRKRCKQLMRNLKRIRKAAGPARDDDVLMLRLAPAAEKDPASGAAQLYQHVKKHRKAAQREIVRVAHRQDDFSACCEKLVKKIEWREEGKEPPVINVASAQLGALLADLLAANQQDKSDPHHLHQLRIEGKHLRYAMEVFSGAFPKGFRADLYPDVEKLQGMLGDVQDHATAIDRFSMLRTHSSSEAEQAMLATMIEEETRLLDDSRNAFLVWWTDERAAAVEAKFRSFLVND